MFLHQVAVILKYDCIYQLKFQCNYLLKDIPRGPESRATMSAGQLQHRRFDPSKAFSSVLREPQVQADHQQVIGVKINSIAKLQSLSLFIICTLVFEVYAPRSRSSLNFCRSETYASSKTSGCCGNLDEKGK